MIHVMECLILQGKLSEIIRNTEQKNIFDNTKRLCNDVVFVIPRPIIALGYLKIPYPNTGFRIGLLVIDGMIDDGIEPVPSNPAKQDNGIPF